MHLPDWHNHQLILNLQSHLTIQLPPLPTPDQSYEEWINIISKHAKTANKEVRNITTKYTR